MAAGRILPEPEVRFQPRCAAAGSCASWPSARGAFFAPRLPNVFPPGRMGPRRETICPLSHTGLYTQRSVRNPAYQSGRTFGAAAGEQNNKIWRNFCDENLEETDRPASDGDGPGADRDRLCVRERRICRRVRPLGRGRDQPRAGTGPDGRQDRRRLRSQREHDPGRPGCGPVPPGQVPRRRGGQSLHRRGGRRNRPGSRLGKRPEDHQRQERGRDHFRPGRQRDPPGDRQDPQPLRRQAGEEGQPDQPC